MEKPLPSYDASERVFENESRSDAKSTGSWRDFITIAKMGIVNSNLITTFTGIWLALRLNQQSLFQNLDTIIFTLLGSALVIAGSCSLNNYIDRDIDQMMERTKDRPSATGRLKPNQVLWAGLVLLTLGIFSLLQAGAIAAVLGSIGAFVYVVIYTLWLKRTHSLNTVVGAISGAIPPLIGWAAIDPSLSSDVPWVLFWIMFLWQPPHFLALAMKRAKEYRRAGIPMLPVVAGFSFTKRQMVTYVTVLVPVSLFLYPLGELYTISAAVLGVGWLLLGICGFYMKDEMKWSRFMFVYSLNYMTILFAIMVVAGFFK